MYIYIYIYIYLLLLLLLQFNPFVPKATFLYPLKASEILTVF